MMRFQREVTGVVEVYFGVRVIALEGLSARRQKEWVVRAPDCEKRRPIFTEILLELRIERDVAGIIQEQVELDLVIAEPGQQRGVKLVCLGCYKRLVLDAVEVLGLGRLWREEVT